MNSTSNSDGSLRESTIGDVIRLLVDMLGETIVSQSARLDFELVEEIRGLSKAWRAGETSASAELRKTSSALAESVSCAGGITATVVKAFLTYFQLVNLAEEHERVRILEHRAEQAFIDKKPMDESIAAACQTLKREGVDAETMQSILNRLEIRPVFTAHPTESRRRTVRQILKRISQMVDRIQSSGTFEFQRPALRDQLHSLIVLLWQSDEIRQRRLTVMDEVRNTGLYFFEETLFDVVPVIYEELKNALADSWPETGFDIPPFLNFGSWIGGDRDGNPLVTDKVTESALRAHKELALKRYAVDVEELYELLSVSRNRASFSNEFLEQLRSELAAFTTGPDDVVYRFDQEPYRQMLVLIFRKIQATREDNRKPWAKSSGNSGGYRSASQFLAELKTIDASLQQNRGAELTQGLLSRLIRRVEVFGFHLATLDVRQHAKRHRQAIAEILESQGIANGYQELSEVEKIALLNAELNSDRRLTANLNFSAPTSEIVSIFALILQAKQNVAVESMQTYIISMSESVSNILEVLLLMRDTGLLGKLDLVPLFETVDDLKRAPHTMATLFENEHYRQHLEMRNRHQQIMIGYSDSNKDGGYLRANWMLFTSQRELAQTCKSRNVELTLFHGRGGSLGRGGGPANRAILAQPPESVNGRIRVTEQGEVVSSRYSNTAIARRHLQQLLHAVICSTGSRPEYANLARWSEIMDQISSLAYVKYRSLVDHPEFIRYFQSATPIDLVENLNIGSRPSRRNSSTSIDDLRAIPWVFSWTQSRADISSWYGIGSALQSWCGNDHQRLNELNEMFRAWPFFNTLFKNVHLGLGRADMDIAELYAQLANEVSRCLFEDIRNEFQLTTENVLKVTRYGKILDTEPWLQHSIRMRNPYVDPLNFIQVALLERLRKGPELDESAREELIRVLANSVNGIAAGLQNVG